MSEHRSTSELIAESKRKYSLARARLRRGHGELALVSLHRSLEDAFRAHLLLHRSPAAGGDWLTLFEALHEDQQRPLTEAEGQHVWNMQRLYQTLVQGDTITVSPETLHTYQQTTAALLIGYGVLVVAPEEQGTPPAAASLPSPWHWHAATLWRRYRKQLLPVLVLLCIFLIGAATTIAITSNQVPTLPGMRPESERVAIVPGGNEPGMAGTVGITPTLTTGIAVGRAAFVREDITDGLALRAEPGTDAAVPITLYLAGGSAVRVVDGPIEMGGNTWWKVRAANQEGWCAGEYLEVRRR